MCIVMPRVARALHGGAGGTMLKPEVVGVDTIEAAQVEVTIGAAFLTL